MKKLSVRPSATITIKIIDQEYIEKTDSVRGLGYTHFEIYKAGLDALDDKK